MVKETDVEQGLPLHDIIKFLINQTAPSPGPHRNTKY